MEILLPVAFLHVCGLLFKAKYGMGSAESYLIALMSMMAVLYIGGIFDLLLPAAVCAAAAVAVWFFLFVRKCNRGGVPI